jgi:multiple antibiotic resistance protein
MIEILAFIVSPKLYTIPVTFIDDLVKSIIALFVVIDPIGSVPLFIAITQNMEKKERKSISKVAIITAAALLIVFAVAGSKIFEIFGISVSSFMVAGGVLLFIVSIELLTHGVWSFGNGGGGGGGVSSFSSSVSEESGVVPLAFPILAGPGAITSVIISFQTAGLIVTILSITVVIGITYIVLLFVNQIYRLLGRRGSMIITRVFAVLIAAIAVQYIVYGFENILLK